MVFSGEADISDAERGDPSLIQRTRVVMTPLSANPDPTISTENRLPGVENVYRGDERFLELPRFGTIVQHDVWAGIDVAHRFDQRRLKRDIRVAAGVDPDVIAFRFDGADRVEIGADGSLRVLTAIGTLVESAPVAFQADSKVDVAFELTGQTIRFSLGRYDRSLPLVIDPGLDFMTVVSSPSESALVDIITMIDGTVSVGWTTASLSVFGFTRDALIERRGTSGELLWRTTFGGTMDNAVGVSLCSGPKWNPCSVISPDPFGTHGPDQASAVTSAGFGPIYVTGDTSSLDLPLCGASAQPELGDPDVYDTDALIARFNPDTGACQWATYLGGTGIDEGTAITTTADGSVWIAGRTFSIDLPHINAFQDEHGGGPQSNLLDHRSDGLLANYDANGARKLVPVCSRNRAKLEFDLVDFGPDSDRIGDASHERQSGSALRGQRAQHDEQCGYREPVCRVYRSGHRGHDSPG
ncbi:MAG: hypothetical protein ACI9OJ_005479 [Myxococcota bacterium]